MSVYLFMFEFRNYFIIKTKSELLIDDDNFKLLSDKTTIKQITKNLFLC